MKTYKDVWISQMPHGKYLVTTKAGVKYIARPPGEGLDDAIERAKSIRSGDRPIRLLSTKEGKFSSEIVG